MKKYMLCFIALILIFSLAACGEGGSDEGQIIGGSAIKEQSFVKPSDSTEGSTENTEDSYYYILDSIKIIPGMTISESSGLPEAKSVFEQPSCAIDGSEIIYSYEGVEVTVLDDGKKSYVYSIYFTDSSAKTCEGLAVGDELSAISSAYGDNCLKNGNSISFEKGGTVLNIITQNDSVISIEIRMA